MDKDQANSVTYEMGMNILENSFKQVIQESFIKSARRSEIVNSSVQQSTIATVRPSPNEMPVENWFTYSGLAAPTESLSVVGTPSTPSAIDNWQSCLPQGVTILPPPTNRSAITIPVYYQQQLNGTTVPTRNVFLQNSNSLRGNDQNSMTIQIGLQCVNQTNPVNVNSPNEMLQMIRNSSKDGVGESALPGTANKINPTAPSDHSDHTAPDQNRNGMSVDEDEIADIVQIALQSCDIAENLAHAHRNRPCFKKIDSLCARMKQDLIRPDGVLANINSQGIPWAIKDLIFVFTRIMNAWIIMKGYVRKNPEGLARIQNTFTDDFNHNFAVWQKATKDFMGSLINSALNLDQSLQAQRGVLSTGITTNGNLSNYKMNDVKSFIKDPKRDATVCEDPIKYFAKVNAADQNNLFGGGKYVAGKNCGSIDSVHSLLDSNYLAAVVQDSEETQREIFENESYFRTGLYTPVLREQTVNCPKFNKLKIDSVDSDVIPVKTIFTTSTPKDKHKYGTFDLEKEIFQLDADAEEAFNNGYLAGLTDPIYGKKSLYVSPPSVKSQPINNKSRDYKLFGGENVKKPLNSMGSNDKEKIDYLLENISNLNEAKYFFTAQFTRNYFPGFHKIVPNYIDLRSIVMKSQIGGYRHVHEIVNDLRQIIHSANVYLKENPSQTLLVHSISAFEKKLEYILAEDVFNEYNFGINNKISPKDQ